MEKLHEIKMEVHLFFNGQTVKCEWQVIQNYDNIIAAGMTQNYKNMPVAMEDRAPFLAALSDELQDWGREQLDNPPGGRPFETLLGVYSVS